MPPHKLSIMDLLLLGAFFIIYLENHEEKFKNAIMPFEVKNDLKKYTRSLDWKK